MIYLSTSNPAIHPWNAKFSCPHIPQIYTSSNFKFTHVRDLPEVNKVLFKSKNRHLIKGGTTSEYKTMQGSTCETLLMVVLEMKDKKWLVQ